MGGVGNANISETASQKFVQSVVVLNLRFLVYHLSDVVNFCPGKRPSGRTQICKLAFSTLKSGGAGAALYKKRPTDFTCELLSNTSSLKNVARGQNAGLNINSNNMKITPRTRNSHDP